jgi:hypothetical protein
MAKKIFLLLLAVILCGSVHAQEFEGLRLVNQANWARYFNDLLGYQYESRGNLHFYPSDIYLLYRTVPAGTQFTIQKYGVAPSYPVDRIPYLYEITDSEEDIEKHLRLFQNSAVELQVFPALNQIIIKVNNAAYARVAAQSGTTYDYLAALKADPDRPIEWDFTPAGPTEAGSYEVYGITDRYLSGSYYKDTVVPFGAWLRKINGAWCYLENEWWYKLPDYIAEDIEKQPGQRRFKYFDLNPQVPAARWAGNDFGNYALLWSPDRVHRSLQMGYAPGDLLYEQVMLVKDTVRLLTLDGPYDLESFIAKDQNFAFYKSLSDFINSRGAVSPPGVSQEILNDYRLFKGWELPGDVDPRLLKAFREYSENRLPRDRDARRRALGLYTYLKQNGLLIEKQARWYEKLKKGWGFLMELKKKLGDDFTRMGVLSAENRQNILEEWLTERLEFRKAAPPTEAKYLQELAFTTFFRPEEKLSVFTERESAVMRETIRKILSGEAAGMELESVKALNEYNFGRLLNEILGDLYKSHGCLHVSPRNSYFVYKVLPVGARMNVHPYSENISPEALSGIPLLADLVNFAEDLGSLESQVAVTSEARIEVFPSSGNWILYLKDKPFAQISVKGGPRAPFYMMQGRDSSGKPQFEGTLAYPTTPGKYYIFEKVTDYISNLYRDTTVIPMGGTIRRAEKGWIFLDKFGVWKQLPPVIEDDLRRPPEARAYTYYDAVRNSSDEVVEVKWGSHPFGKYSLQTSVNRRSPFPELIHSSGDLIMEERQIINDMIALLSLPYDSLEDCVDYDPNFAYYKICSDFVLDPSSGEAIGLKERAYYKLYYNLALSSEEAAVLPADLFAVVKVVRGQKLDGKETDLLVKEGLAVRRKGKASVDWHKINGMNFDMYQYVVAIKKYSNHYAALKNHWGELNNLRLAMLKDFNNFVIKDPVLFHSFMRELMLARTRLEKLSQEEALKILNRMLERNG